MTTRRKILLCLLAGLFLWISWFAFNSNQETAARQKLDNLLGQTNDENLPGERSEQPSATPESTELPGAGLPINGGSFFGLPMPLSGTGVDVQELADQYILRIPLADLKDAATVKLNVSPHQIEVSGQTGSKENGMAVTSSFMQSFTTSQEVLPDRISRKTEKNGDHNELVITIPKKSPGQQDSAQSKSLPDLQDSSEDRQAGQPDEENSGSVSSPQQEPDPNPLNGIENKVI